MTRIEVLVVIVVLAVLVTIILPHLLTPSIPVPGLFVSTI
jgi:hypothetical protein